MRRKYKDCKRKDGNCAICAQLVPEYDGFIDCHGKKMTKLAMRRMFSGMTQLQLSNESGVSVYQIQRTEAGDGSIGNMTARNFMAIADALGVNPRDILE